MLTVIQKRNPRKLEPTEYSLLTNDSGRSAAERDCGQGVYDEHAGEVGIDQVGSPRRMAEGKK